MAVIQLATDFNGAGLVDGDILKYEAVTKTFKRATGLNAMAIASPVFSGTRTVQPTSFAAAGATQGNATLVSSGKVFVTATASTEGVKLPVWATGIEVDMSNVGAARGSKVWPSIGVKIMANATNAADNIILAALKNTIYKAVNANQWIAFRSA